ncbi:Zn(2)-C6 fungal-specific transcription factor [Phycomyces blakesleeanus NRRL 1555(-)]|uniref:Zn(2)-C6 fungal-specific transcription factor n=1 Tax=Phycomyces blakesleeanus (strain ATCC 8743b / DSM 1359 / FGSC 10004 / NBRC 33097 / NRRL 1555) TaxID=763407 RepID=A0A167MEL1_PHYB8|nr:Zn(2)-C6 fungal-specific transcription factor [Phycomyces blakesleeanus NRRL 1555(-)]OAD72626.1 Zn(2)-C6 fungal-specific transcription factor [Phycomyces blakesleeanus NRRL 1555(-)]|eukprot:XP_018290666.1 Zn(2)-C6 fungal-specific transcription factor [Phycomyces blakesleeanus NRRL 1555(-)]
MIVIIQNDVFYLPKKQDIFRKTKKNQLDMVSSGNNDTQSSATPPKAKKRRTRNATACMRCRELKKKCDNNLPSCTRCIEFGANCLYLTYEEYQQTLAEAVIELSQELDIIQADVRNLTFRTPQSNNTNTVINNHVNSNINHHHHHHHHPHNTNYYNTYNNNQSQSQNQNQDQDQKPNLNLNPSPSPKQTAVQWQFDYDGSESAETLEFYRFLWKMRQDYEQTNSRRLHNNDTGRNYCGDIDDIDYYEDEVLSPKSTSTSTSTSLSLSLSTSTSTSNSTLTPASPPQFLLQPQSPLLNRQKNQPLKTTLANSNLNSNLKVADPDPDSGSGSGSCSYSCSGTGTKRNPNLKSEMEMEIEIETGTVTETVTETEMGLGMGTRVGTGTGAAAPSGGGLFEWKATMDEGRLRIDTNICSFRDIYRVLKQSQQVATDSGLCSQVSNYPSKQGSLCSYE